MNREIKFRVWDKSENTMLDWDGIVTHIKRTGGAIDLYFGFDNEMIMMQYTGLKDKNGVEIYEGDLLREHAKDKWDLENYSCFEVFFHDGDAHFDYNIGYSMSRMHNHGSVCGGYVPSFKPKTVLKMEVIGNVHQHPELLNS